MATRPSHSTPPRPTPRGYNQYNSSKLSVPAETRRQQLRKNMDGYFLGPMDPTEFMDSFMPMNSRNLGVSPDGVDFKEVYNQATEKLMYSPFVSRHFLLPSIATLTHAELNSWPSRTKCAPTTWRVSPGIDPTPKYRSNRTSRCSPKTMQKVPEKTRMRTLWSLRFYKWSCL